MKRQAFRHPEISQTWFDIASVCTIIGHYDTALQAYRNALATDATSFDAMYGIGQIALIRNDIDLLRDIIEKFKLEEAERFRFLVLNAHYFLKINDIKRSFECFQRAGDFLILDNFLLYGIGLFFEAVGKGTLAGRIFLRHYNQCSLVGCNAELLFRIGMIYKNEGFDAIALRIFNVLMQMHDNPLPWSSIALQIGHINIMQGEDEKAKQIIEDVLSDDQDNIFVHRLIAWLIFKEKDTNKGLERILRMGLKLGDPYILYVSARLLFLSNKLDESFEIYKKAIKRDKLDPWFWNSLGILYAKNNQYEEARGKFTIAISLDKTFEEARINLRTATVRLMRFRDEDSTQVNNKMEDIEGKNGCYSEIDLNEIQYSDEHLESTEFVDVEPDLVNSQYFSTQLFLGGPLFRFDKENIDLYEREIQQILTKALE